MVLTLARNFDHQAAVTAGLQHAGGDAVAVIDSELQDPPELISEMIAKWRQGYDVVYGVRAERTAGLAKRAAYKIVYRFMRAMATVDVTARLRRLSLMDRRAVDALNALPERNRFVRGLRSWIGLRQIGIPYQRPARAAGSSKYTTFKLIGLALDGILSMSAKPLLLLLNDMRPCPNRNLTFDANAGIVPITRQWILDDAEDARVGFWTFRPDALMMDNGVPPEVVRFWRTQARCESIDASNALCFPRERP